MFKRCLNLFLYSIISVIALLIVINSIFLTNKFSDGQYFSAIYLIGLTLSLMIIIGFLSRGLAKLNKTNKKIIYIFSAILVLTLQLIISFNVFGACGVDDFDVRIQASKLSYNDYSWATYFTNWAPQNVGATIAFSYLLKVAYRTVGTQHATIFINIITMLLIDIAIIAGYKITSFFDKLELRVHPQDVFFLLSIFFWPLYLAALIMYTDPLSLCAITFSLYYYCKYIKASRGYIWLILSALFAALAAYLKMNAIILFIALVLHLIFFTNFRLKKKTILLIMLFIFFMIGHIGCTGISQLNHFRNNKLEGWPATYWIAMGLNKETNGRNAADIVKNNKKVTISLYDKPGSLPSKRARQIYEKENLKREIKTTSFKQFLILFANKIRIQWTWGNMALAYRNYAITPMPQTKIAYKYIFGSKRALLDNVSQVIYICLWIGVLIEGLKNLFDFKNIKQQVLVLFIVGIFIFHTFMWEVMPRYAYIVIIPLLIIGSNGIATLCNSLQFTVFKRQNKFMYILITVAFILLTAGAITNSRNFTVQKHLSNNIITGQAFFRTQPVFLEPNQKIEESFISKGHFSNFQLTNPGIQDSDAFKVYLSGSKYHNHKLDPLNINKVNGSKGKYTITIINKANSNQQINLGIMPRIDLLQKQSSLRGKYIGFETTIVKNETLINKYLYWSLYIFIVILLILCVFMKILRRSCDVANSASYDF